jgi:hypothetical protein
LIRTESHALGNVGSTSTTRSSSESFPSLSRSIVTDAQNALESDAILNTVCGVTGAIVSRFAKP